MNTLYLQCNMGAAGDMLMAALSQLHPEPDTFVQGLNALNIPGIRAERQIVKKQGINGTHMRVMYQGMEEDEHIHEHHHHDQDHDQDHDHDHDQDQGHEHENEHHREQEHHHHQAQAQAHTHTHHVHRGMEEIEGIITSLPVSDWVKDNALAVYRLIAEAESNAHGCQVSEIHFHEVGTMDAIADIVGVCMLMEDLAPDRVVVSPINMGSGTVRCAHGILPVPAPATAYILQGVPVYSNEVVGELCTPTGAALIKHFATDFGAMPVMSISKVGYGFGTREFDTLNCVRAFIGETQDKGDVIVQLSCNMDDMTGERIGFAMDRLFEAGALEVYTVPIGMKKSRPGILFNCICRPEDKERMVRLIFKHTTTIGIRETVHNRHVLDRAEYIVETPYGKVWVKSSEGYGVKKTKVEYNDLARLAVENDVDISRIMEDIQIDGLDAIF